MWGRKDNTIIHVGELAGKLAGIADSKTNINGKDVHFFKNTDLLLRQFEPQGHGKDIANAIYDYTGPYKPMSHQRETVAFLLENSRAFVANGLGTGKTLSALWAADCLMRMGQIRRVLIVAPISALWNAWFTTLPTVVPAQPFKVLKGTADRKRSDCNDLQNRYLLVNPESLHLIENDLPAVDLVIVDESTKFKTWTARRTKALYRIAKERKVWLMSATPAPQEPTDAYAQIKIMRAGQYMSFTMFRDMTMLKRSMFTWVPRHNAMETVSQELQPCIRFSRDECLDLPDLSIIDHRVPLTKEQEKAIKELQDKAVAMIGDEPITAVNAAVVVSKILQVQSGAVYGEVNEEGERSTVKVEANGVFESILDIVENNAHPVIVYVRFRSTVEAILAHLRANGISAEGITAEESGKQRQEIFQRMQDGQLKVIVAVASTISHGVTLTAADTIIWATPELSFEIYDQANGRIYRKGQTKKCVIYRLYYDAFSHRLLQRLDQKTKLQDCLLEMLKEKTVDIGSAN